VSSSKTSARHTVTPHQRDIGALAHALVPIAKLCMKSGMGAGELQIAVKIACVSVAAESAKLGNRLNHSRIAATTGLTRKEVRALFGVVKSGGIGEGKEIAKQRTTRVLHGWRTDPEFVDRRGLPIPLVIRGQGATFNTLVRRYGGDVTPISVLNELVRTGAVSVGANGRVTVRKTTPRIKGYGSDVVAEISNRLRDFGGTLVDNIESPETPIFVGFGEIRGLSADEAALFQVTFSDRAASLVDGVDRWQASQTRIRSKKSGKDAAAVRVGLGVYLLGQQSPVAEPPDNPTPTNIAIRRRIKR
jgi:Family of unknown function (DUF6502)